MNRPVPYTERDVGLLDLLERAMDQQDLDPKFKELRERLIRELPEDAASAAS